MPRYFCKVSWTNDQQPLIRVHDNGFMDVDWVLLSGGSWELQDQFQKQNYGRCSDNKNDFCIDFMMQIPESE